MSPLEKKRIAAVKTATDEAGIAGTSSPDRGAGAPEPCLTRTCMKMCLS